MQNDVGLKSFFQNELHDVLKNLESIRKKIALFYSFGIFGFVTFFIQVLLVQDKSISNNITFTILPLACIVMIVFFILGYLRYKKYKKAFKLKIVTPLIQYLNPTWVYQYENYISQNEYHESKLFRNRVDRYNGDDLVFGTIEKTNFKFSELHTEYKTESRDSKGNRKTNWHTIFRGIFALVDFNKEIKGETYVLPDTAEKFFGKWGQKLQDFSSFGKLVKLENPEFEKEFVVYGSDQIEPRYILTPSIMEAMVRLKTKYKRRLHFSFIGSRVYIAVSFNKSLFEPRIFRSGVNYADIEEMRDLFGIIEAIIHELNLNTRIWTKQ